jgi:subtilase family serine protease
LVSRVLSGALVAAVLFASWAVPVQAAGGHRAHTNTVRGHHAGAVGVAGPTTTGGPAPAGYIPCDITKAYGLDPVPGDGNGQTIAIVDAYNLKDPPGDFMKFDTTFLPPNAGRLDVHQMSATAGDAKAQGWADEIDLDIQWAHGIAPAAHIWLVEAASNSTDDMLFAIAWALKYTNPDIVLMAWTIEEPEAGHDSAFPAVINGNHPVAYVGATGDAPPNGMVGWPSNSSRVLSVGGTTLHQEAAG